MEKREEDKDKKNSEFLLRILVTSDGAIHPCAPTVELRWQSRQTLDYRLTGILVLNLLTENAIVG